MKVYAQKIVVYDREAYKKKGAAAVLSPSNMKSWSWQQDQAGTYTGGEFTYTSPATEKEIKVTVGKGSRILKQSGKADSKADAERKIKAAGGQGQPRKDQTFRHHCGKRLSGGLPMRPGGGPGEAVRQVLH